ncbi:putative SPX domain-containing protein [Helianthus anomalus]
MVCLDILNHIKINVTPESGLSPPWKTIFDGTKCDLSFSKSELRTAQAKLKQAFVEFHRKLRLLKSYCFLNQLAISKIMKKNASKAYLEMVKRSYLSQSDEVVKLMERVESAFITHFANANRGLGCFFGCLISLVVAVILTIRARDLLKSAGRDQYMINIFPLYSLFAYIVLHMLMYAGNIYFWKRFHVNYAFIFGLNRLQNWVITKSYFSTLLY